MLTSDKIHYIIAKQVTERTTNKLSETDKYGILAQLGEHLPYKQRVIGSSPIGSICRSGGTGRRTGLKILRDLYSRTGSIPVCGIS